MHFWHAWPIGPNKSAKFRRSGSPTSRDNRDFRLLLWGNGGQYGPVSVPSATLSQEAVALRRHVALLACVAHRAKQGRTEEFNTEFYKTVERGVFKEITKEEMAAWDGPVNYISMVEAFKEEFATESDDKLILDGLAHMAMRPTENVRSFFGRLNAVNKVIKDAYDSYTIKPAMKS